MLKAMQLFREMDELVALQTRSSEFFRWKNWGTVDLCDKKGTKFPLLSFEVGSTSPEAPCFIITSGVHGLERVGTHVALQFFAPLLEQLRWDQNLQELFTRVRLAALPIVNPSGMSLNSRANANGVDIMRNAPFEGKEKGLPLVSGHHLSPLLPWYRGPRGSNPELETQVLIDFVQGQIRASPFALALDIHSGFGVRDRLWHPWSYSKDPIPDMDWVLKFGRALRSSHPFHFYKVEPQTASYVIHGDPWDLLYDSSLKNRKPSQVFLPFTLEMGSWTWLRKNPGQLFRRDGIYNPIVKHRYNRIMRRHRPLLDFFLHFAANHSFWREQQVENL